MRLLAGPAVVGTGAMLSFCFPAFFVMAQLSLFDTRDPIASVIAELAMSGHEERGAVFTRREVAEFILDLVGYTADRPISRQRLLEPAFGHGDFLVPAVERLLKSYAGTDPVGDLAEAIRGFEIHPASVRETRARLLAVFAAHGYDAALATRLCSLWLVEADYLLSALRPRFTHVVGNPPYVRQEMVAGALMAEYRARFPTIYDRADLYIPFIEHSLRQLDAHGQLAFICSDRWMKNRYGGPLRALVATGYHLAAYVDMVGTPAFDADVIAYPAITVIARGRGTTTRIAHRPALERDNLARLSRALRGEERAADVTTAAAIVQGAEPWILHAPDRTELVRRLEARFPTLEEAGCAVGIGVATGADKVYIAPYDTLDVEEDRKLPLVTTRDIQDGTVAWRGLGVVNPFRDDGKLVPLADYPRLRAYLERHGETIRARNVAQRAPDAWYRTIDRITPVLAQRPKLLIPDIKGAAHIVLEAGGLYPHHNLYYIVSESWDLRALQAVLRAGIANLFVSAYSVKMAGGHLRFQAQYLRRIRLPAWDGIDPALRAALLEAVQADDRPRCRAIAHDIYGLSAAERAMLAED